MMIMPIQQLPSLSGSFFLPTEKEGISKIAYWTDALEEFACFNDMRHSGQGQAQSLTTQKENVFFNEVGRKTALQKLAGR